MTNHRKVRMRWFSKFNQKFSKLINTCTTVLIAYKNTYYTFMLIELKSDEIKIKAISIQYTNKR